VLLFGTALVMWWNRVLAPMWRRAMPTAISGDRSEKWI